MGLRKVTQITAVNELGERGTRVVTVCVRLYAVCDDGTLWTRRDGPEHWSTWEEVIRPAGESKS